MERKLPKDFYWGGAVAANQCEGAWNVDGRGMTRTDVTTGGTVNTPRMVTFIDKDGNVIQSSLERRLMSTPLEQLKEMNNSIGVAGGSTKSEAILAALKGNYLDVLITDETTATNVLRLKNQE